MSKEDKKIVPQLRFPEFNNDEAWSIKRLSKLGKIINGLTYSPRDVQEDGLLVLRSSNVQDGQIVLDDCVFVRPDIKGANLSLPNDILICVRNGSKQLIGKNAILPEGLPKATHGAFMTMFRASNPSFAFQLFQTEGYRNQVKADLGATINSINTKNFIKYEFAVPSNPNEQQKIAACLSSLDEVINAETEKLELLQDHKKGLLQQLFPQDGETQPKYRFPEFENYGDWEDKTIKQVCEKPFSGGTPSSNNKDYYGGEIPFIRSAEIDKETTALFLTELGLKNSSAKMVKKGDVLVAMYGANSGDVGISKINGAINQAVLCLRSEASNVFLYQYLILKKDWITNKYLQGGQGNLSGDIIKSVELLFPKLEEQQKIANCLTSVDNLIEAQNQKIDSLQNHKKGLLQHLFPNVNDV